MAAANVTLGTRLTSSTFVSVPGDQKRQFPERKRHPAVPLLEQIQEYLSKATDKEQTSNIETGTLTIFAGILPNTSKRREDKDFLDTLIGFANYHPQMRVNVGFNRHRVRGFSSRRGTRSKSKKESLTSSDLPDNLHLYYCDIDKESVTNAVEIRRKKQVQETCL